jgi:hypothetical protein
LSDKIMTLYQAGFERFAEVTMKLVFRDGVLCSLVEECQHFRQSCCILAHFYNIAQPHIPEDSWLQDISSVLK